MTFTAGSNGGEYKHKLTLNELDNMIWHCSGHSQEGGLKQFFTQTTSGSGINTRAENFNIPHNNIQPYIVVYFWERTA